MMDETLAEQVQKEMEDERNRKANFVALKKKRSERPLLPGSVFMDSVAEAQKELSEAILFIKALESQPELIFFEAERYFRSTKGMIYNVLNHWRNPRGQISAHDFQVFLADIANQYFQAWLKQKGIPESFILKVRTPNQFPSIFAVYQGEDELMQFNLLEQWYGVRGRPATEEEMLNEHQRNLERLDRSIAENGEDVKKAILRRDNPLKLYKGWKNRLVWVFLNKKKMRDGFDKLVDREKKSVLFYEKEKERTIQLLPELLEKAVSKREAIALVEPFFQSIGYQIKEEKSRLY